MVRAFLSQLVDLGSVSLSSHNENFKNGTKLKKNTFFRDA